MSGFEVRTDALRTARSRLQELADDSASARSYSQDYLEITSADDGHLKNPVDGVAEDVRSRLATLFDTVDRLLRDSGTELARAARWYDQSDEQAVRAADAQVAVLTQSGNGFRDLPEVPDTTPSDPGDYVPAEHGAPEAPEGPDDGEVIMAPGPIGQPWDQPTGGGMA